MSDRRLNLRQRRFIEGKQIGCQIGDLLIRQKFAIIAPYDRARQTWFIPRYHVLVVNPNGALEIRFRGNAWNPCAGAHCHAG